MKTIKIKIREKDFTILNPSNLNLKECLEEDVKFYARIEKLENGLAKKFLDNIYTKYRVATDSELYEIANFRLRISEIESK